jgi:hypothetical protein
LLRPLATSVSCHEQTSSALFDHLVGGRQHSRHIDEANLMVMEKVQAMFEAGARLLAGGTACSVVDRYREHVAANAKRLSY